MIKFIELSHDNQHLWNEYAAEHPQSEVFHLAQWAEIYKETYNYTPYYYLLKENQNIVGLLPFIHQKGLLKNVLATPPAGLLLSHPAKHNQEVFLFTQSLKNKLKTTDISIYNQYRISPDLFESQENIRILKQLPETVEALDKDIGKKRRWGVRKGDEYGLNPKIIKPTPKDIDLFYSIYGTNYRDLGTPVNSKKFFSKQLEYLKDHISMLIVFKEKKPICAKWMLEYKSMIISTDSATLREFFPTRINDFQIYHAMKYAIEKGFKSYNMGRSQLNSGTHIFKTSWGECQVQPYPVYRMKEQAGITEKKNKFGLFIKIWQNTPVFFTNIAGPMLRKNMELD